MAIVNLTPDIDVPEFQLCADRWYLFEETDAADSYEWVVVSSPTAVNNSDVEFSSVNAKRTYVRVPILGTYCFTVRKGVL